MQVKFEQNRILQTTRNFELFNKKPVVLKSFLTKRWRHFGRRFCSWNNCSMLSYQFPDYHLSVFQKLRCSGPTRETRLKVAPNMAWWQTRFVLNTQIVALSSRSIPQPPSSSRWYQTLWSQHLLPMQIYRWWCNTGQGSYGNGLHKPAVLMYI